MRRTRTPRQAGGSSVTPGGLSGLEFSLRRLRPAHNHQAIQNARVNEALQTHQSDAWPPNRMIALGRKRNLAEPHEKWWPEAIALGHPWPSRHRCIHAQWNRTTDTRIFSALKINKLLIWLDEAICGTVVEKQAETTGYVRLAQRAKIPRCSAGVPGIRMRNFHQQTPWTRLSRQVLRGMHGRVRSRAPAARAPVPRQFVEAQPDRSCVGQSSSCPPAARRTARRQTAASRPAGRVPARGGVRSCQNNIRLAVYL